MYLYVLFVSFLIIVFSILSYNLVSDDADDSVVAQVVLAALIGFDSQLFAWLSRFFLIFFLICFDVIEILLFLLLAQPSITATSSLTSTTLSFVSFCFCLRFFFHHHHHHCCSTFHPLRYVGIAKQLDDRRHNIATRHKPANRRLVCHVIVCHVSIDIECKG